jgi:hypothetical protein
MRIYPYDVLNGDVKLKIAEVALDGNPIIPAFIDEERRTIGIREIGSTQWESLSFRVRVEGPSSELSLASQWTNVAVLVKANCKRSNTRVVIAAKPDAGPPGRWTGFADLDRVDWYGTITVSGSIAATVDGVDNRLIGVADEWHISLDDLPHPPVGQAMTIRWDDFTEPEDSSNSYLTLYAEEPYFVRMDPTDPVLFLNSSFHGLQGLLSDRKRRPAAERALHDQLRGAIAADTWLLLFVDALAHIELVDGDVTWPEEEWRTHVLQSLLQLIYGASDSEALRRAHDDWNEPAAAAALLERVLPAAFAQGRSTKLLRSAIRQLPMSDNVIETDDGEEGTL